MKRSRVAVTAIILAAIVAGWLAWEWQPDRQARKATQKLLSAVENRDWKSVRDLMAPAYADAWGYDRAGAIRDAAEAFRQFFGIHFVPGEFVVAKIDSGAVQVDVPLRLEGNGTAVAQLVMSRINELDEPFRFEWRKESWKPWDWLLYSTDQSQLLLSADSSLP